MRRLAVLALVVTAAGMTLRYVRQKHPAWAGNAWKQITLPYRVLRLRGQPADTSIRMPVAGVRRSSLRNTWHAPRGADRLHEGQDIFAPQGAPVLSATAGIVTKIGQDRLGGNVVLVLGPGGRSYYYAHLSHHAELLRTGDDVIPGDVLGYVGNTGNARGTPPHLHFGIYTSSGVIDPLPLVTEGALE